MSKGDYHDDHTHTDVKNFIKKLGKSVKAKKTDELLTLYEKDYTNLTERFYKGSKWPLPDSIQSLVENDRNAIILYKDLYYRHMYSRLGPSVTVDDRFNSFGNYVNLFNSLLGASAPELPAVWLWDVIDEFIYQFRSFHTMRRSKRKSESDADELQLLKDHPHVWGVQTVVQYLHALVKKAHEAPADTPVTPFYKNAAEFSLIGLCRVNCLLGDYYGALKVLEALPLDMVKRPYYDCQGILACHTTLHYYMSFAYMMLARYNDAITTAVDGVVFLNRNKNLPFPVSHQGDLINKKTERMLHLLAICLAVNPQSIDDGVSSLMKETVSETDMTRMQSGDLNVFEQTFEHANPKFINPAMPDFDTHSDDETRLVQVQMFLNEIKECMAPQDLTSILQLCKTVSLEKLTTLARKGDVAALVGELLAFKIKNKQIKHKDGKSPIGGVWTHASSIDCLIKNDIVTVSESVEVDRYGQYFIGQILKYEEIIDAVIR